VYSKERRREKEKGCKMHNIVLRIVYRVSRKDYEKFLSFSL